MRIFLLAALAVLLPLAGVAGPPPRAIPSHAIVVYDDSWNEPPAADAAGSSLATLPDYIGLVMLAFARPDLAYAGGLELAGTGLEYRYSGRVLRDAIALLRTRHPATRVLLSVGGAAYDNWRGLDVAAAARLVHDLDADGIDIDFEPHWPGCATAADLRVRCATDATWMELLRRFRAVLPRPALLTASVWSVGAYGEGAFRASRPVSRYTGFMLALLRSPVAAQLDLLSINAYDAGSRFDPIEAFRAYRAVWPGPLALGVEVRRAGGSGPFFSAAATEALARRVAEDRAGAMMVYPLLAMPEGAGAAGSPDGRGLAAAACRGMGLPGCAVLPP